MNIEELLAGGMIDHAALFGVNVAPTQSDIEAAQAEAILYGEAAERLVSKVGLRKGHYVAEQPIYGPLVRMLSLAGWTIGGSGFFSAVFYKGGLAIKISLRGSGDAAMDYLYWCKDHQGMPGIPVLHAMKQGEFTYTVLMDRLESAKHLLRERSDDFDDYLSAEFNEVSDALENGVAPVSFKTAATALAVREEFMGRGEFDMHIGNVMVDRDGNLVITDPLGRSNERDGSYGGYTYSGSAYYGYSQAA